MSLFRAFPDLTHKINNVRALSALSVVVYHYLIYFFTEQTASAAYAIFAPLEFSFQDFIQNIKDLPFDFGRFAVSEFFLISGFLIPSLLERYPTRLSFFKNRFFRLWPVYAIGLAINVVFVWIACLYNHTDFAYTLYEIMASFFCLRDVLGLPFITGIVWTFEIEIKFLIFCILIYPLIQTASLRKIVFIKGVLFFSLFYGGALLTEFLYETYQIVSPEMDQFFWVFLKTASNFCFLLIGMGFSLFLSKKISQRLFLECFFILSALFLLENYLMYKEHSWIRLMLSSFPALFLFVWYIAKNYQKRSHDIPYLRSISEMSYPLYLIHAIPGYILIYILYDYGVPLFVSICISAFLTFYIAWMVHKFLEKPIRKKWSRKETSPSQEK